MNEMTLTHTQQMLSVINEGLMLVPYGRAAPVVAEINRQIQKQFDLANDAKEALIEPAQRMADGATDHGS